MAMQQQEHYQQSGQQWKQEQEQQEQRQPLRLREGKAVVTRVVDELMIFIAALPGDGLPGEMTGLVFKPKVIKEYSGESLKEIGIDVDAELKKVEWDDESLIVHSVEIHKLENELQALSRES